MVDFGFNYASALKQRKMYFMALRYGCARAFGREEWSFFLCYPALIPQRAVRASETCRATIIRPGLRDWVMVSVAPEARQVQNVCAWSRGCLPSSRYSQVRLFAMCRPLGFVSSSCNTPPFRLRIPAPTRENRTRKAVMADCTRCSS